MNESDLCNVVESTGAGVIVIKSGAVSGVNERAEHLLRTKIPDDEPIESLEVIRAIESIRNNARSMDDKDITSNQKCDSITVNKNGTEFTFTDTASEAVQVSISGEQLNSFCEIKAVQLEDGIAYTITDITDKKNSEEIYKVAMTYTADIVGMIKDCGTPTVVESDTQAETGSLISIRTPNNMLESVHENDKSKLVNVIERCIDGEIVKTKARLQPANTDKYKVIEFIFRPANEFSNVTQPIFTGRDITKQHEFRRRRKVMNRVLRHDLRNDMNVVMGRAQIAANADNERIRQQAEEIKRKAESLVELGNKVRKVDQDLHGVDRRIRQINLTRIVNKKIEEFHEEHPKITVKTELEDVFVEGHTLLRSAISNVLENTVEHTDKPLEDVVVDVTCTHEDNGYVHLTITDNGPGIPEGERQVLESGVETDLDHVSGLGLWLVKWVTEGIDGKIKLSNMEEGGTKVEFLLVPSSISPSTENVDEVDALTDDKIDITQNVLKDSTPIETTTRK